MPATTTASTSAASPHQWAGLPVELVRNISGRLHAASDYVRFHAVCCAWRDTLYDDDGGYELPYFLPWLLAPSTAADDSAEDQRCRCIFSKATYRAPGICVRDRRVAYADGAAAWLVRGRKETIFLVNPLTADRMHLYTDERSLDDDWLQRRHRIVYRDGAVLLYDFDPSPPDDDYPYQGRFRAYFLSPTEEKWRCVCSRLGTSDRCCAAAYYDGHIICVDLANCHVLWPGQGCCYLERTREVRAALPDEPRKVRRCSYLLEKEKDGSLLLASVLQEASSTNDRPDSGLSVSLYELHLKAGQNGGEELSVEWVRLDESVSDMSLLAEDVMFLGFPVSFDMKAASFSGEVSGGTAYFVIEGNSAGGLEPCSVYRYSFHDGVATLVEMLPPGWDDARCMWFLPDPDLSAPIGEYEEGSEPAAERTPATQQLRIYAGDLSPKVDNSRLREMFSVYGKVASTRVAYDKRGRSRGFGFVTMATQEGFDKAMAALNAVEEPHGSVMNPFNLFLMLLILSMIFVLCYTFSS